MNAFTAIIPVAGLSSRMGAFKPLLELNGFSMIRLTVQSALDGGVQSACVVTGRNAAGVEAALMPLTHPEHTASVVQELKPLKEPGQGSVCIAHNDDFATSDMLQSIKLGLELLLSKTGPTSSSVPQAVFVLPGDMPGISPRTFAALQKHQQAQGSQVLVPTYEGKRGHPLLISNACFDAVRSFDGEGGLKQALKDFAWQEVAVEDPGILLDADDQAAFATLAQHVRATHGVSINIIEELLDTHQTLPNIRAHTAAVAEVALRMAHALNRHGFGLDSLLAYSGGILHDLNRLEQDHSQVAAAHLRDLGYNALAAVVGAHDRELKLSPRPFTEANLVFVADKLVKETTLIRIDRRYEGALKRFPPDTELGKLILKDSKNAQKLLKNYVELTGDSALLEGVDRFVRNSYERS